MSTSEIKSEIKKIIDTMPESALPFVLNYLEEVKSGLKESRSEVFLKELNNKYSSLLTMLAK